MHSPEHRNVFTLSLFWSSPGASCLCQSSHNTHPFRTLLMLSVEEMDQFPHFIHLAAATLLSDRGYCMHNLAYDTALEAHLSTEGRKRACTKHLHPLIKCAWASSGLLFWHRLVALGENRASYCTPPSRPRSFSSSEVLQVSQSGGPFSSTIVGEVSNRTDRFMFKFPDSSQSSHMPSQRASTRGKKALVVL